MGYGTQEQVATMASTWTNDGIWEDLNIEYPGSNTASNPSLTEVEDWLDQVSAQFNIALGSHAFVPPIDPVISPNAYKAVSQYVVQLVADLCAFKNSSGRYFTEKLMERGITPMAAILKDMNNWIEMNADGLVADNVPQVSTPSIRKQPIFRVIGGFGG
jgi:hypothetical protein